MFLTRLYRPRDYTAWYQQDAPKSLPNSVLGMFRLWIGQSPVQFAFLIFMAGIANASALAAPYVIKLIVDAMTNAPAGTQDRFAYITPLFLLLAAVIVMRFTLQQITWACSYFWRPYRRRLSYYINSYVTEHSPHFFESELSGRIIQKATTLFISLNAINDTVLWNWVPTTFYFTASLFLLGSVNIWLAIGGVIWLAILLTLSFFVGQDISRNASRLNDSKSQVVGRLADVITNIRNMLHYARQTEEKYAFATRENVVIGHEQYWYLSILNVRVLNQTMILGATLAVVGTSVYMWAHGLASIGDISMACTLVLMVTQRASDLTDNLPDLLDNIGTVRDSLDTLVKPRDLLDAPDAKALQPGGGAIDFNHVRFVYPGGGTVFEDFELHIKAGERVGLVGVSGAGKSTLVSLLLRMYDVDGGSVTIDGQNISHVTQQSLRHNVSFIPQDTMLFHRTVRENIAYGRMDATDVEIAAAAQKAQAHEFIMRMPKGYETMVGERGVKLSGGQRQRIAIARALLKNAPILILDEATSALDSEAEHEIQAAIKIAMQGKTVIAIAHRLSTIASLDRLIILDQGKIVEEGSHSALIAKGGVYAALWQHQSGGFLGLE